jgi:LysR family transcriptional regulator, nitrogen assimilation regulatory protein
MTVQLRQLRYFTGIVDAGSFSRAALTLHIAQPALSQQIAELELDLGVPLLQRSARGTQPTAAGGLLYKEAMSILGRVGQLSDLLCTSGPEVEGTVGIGVSHASAPLLKPFMRLCRETFPKVVLRCSVGESLLLRSRFEARNLNFACAFEDEPDSYFERQPLLRQSCYLVSKEPLAGSPHSVSLARLASWPLVLPLASSVIRSKVDRMFDQAGLTPDVAAESDHVGTMLDAVKLGIGCAILPKGDFADVAKASGLVATPIDPKIELTASVIWPAGESPTPAAEAVRKLFVKFAIEHIGRAAPRGAELVHDDGSIAHHSTNQFQKPRLQARNASLSRVSPLGKACGLMKAVA